MNELSTTPLLDSFDAPPQVETPEPSDIKNETAVPSDDELLTLQTQVLQQTLRDKRQNFISRAARVVDDAARSVASGMSFGFADEFAALMQSKLGDRSFTEELALQRARDAEMDPILRLAGEITGSVVTGIGTAGIINPATVGAARVAKFAALGATEGMLSGFGHAEGDIVDRSVGAGIGAGVGAVAGAAAPIIADKVVGFVQFMRGRPELNRAERAAVEKIASALEKDDMTPRQALDELRQLGMSDAMLADLAGQNVKGVARAAAGVPGPVKTMAHRALNEREAASRARINDTIASSTSEENAVETMTNIVARRAKAAKPLYEEALVPDAVRATNPLAGVIRTPTLQNLVEKSSDIKGAISRARGIPEYADLPDYDIILLDKAYKNLGGKMDESMRSGDTVAAHDIGTLKTQLRDAIIGATGGKGHSVYEQALDVFHSESDLVRALQRGRDLLKEKDVEVLVGDVKKMTDGEREMFLVGAGRALREKIDNAQDSTDLAKKLFGNPRVRELIRSALPDGNTYNEFAKVMMQQARFAETKRTMLGGSMTAPREAEKADLVKEAVFAARGNLSGSMFAISKMLGGKSEPTRELGSSLFTANTQKNISLLQLMESEANRKVVVNPFGGAMLGAGIGAQNAYGRR